jgi:hypothetical protein
MYCCRVLRGTYLLSIELAVRELLEDLIGQVNGDIWLDLGLTIIDSDDLALLYNTSN